MSTETKTEELKIDPKEYGLEDKSVVTIEQAFLPKIAERDGYAKIYAEIIKEEITVDLVKRASRLRKDLVKTRTGISDIHRTQKAFFLAAGKFVDAHKNRETKPVEQMEEKLKEIENYYENKESERKEKLAQERMTELEGFEKYNVPGLGEMEEDIYDLVLNGAKLKHGEKIEGDRLDQLEIARDTKISEFNDFTEGVAPDIRNSTTEEFEAYMDTLRTRKSDHDKKEEMKRVKQVVYDDRWEKLLPLTKFTDVSVLTLETSSTEFGKMLSDAVKKDEEFTKEQAKIKAENDRLEKEAEESEAKMKKERHQWNVLNRKSEAKIKNEREANAAKLKAQTEAKEKAEAELQAKEEKEAQAKKEAEDKKRQAQLAPDKEKLEKWINDMHVKIPELSSSQSYAFANMVDNKFNVFQLWALEEISKLK